MTNSSAPRVHAVMPLLVELGHRISRDRSAEVVERCEPQHIDNGTRVTEVKEETTDDE